MQWEAEVLHWIQEVFRQDWLDPIVVAITKLGNVGWFWIASILVCLCLKKQRKMGIYALISLLVTFVLCNLFLKQVVGRIRPYDAYPIIEPLVERLQDPSFPSGHSAISFCVAMIYYYQAPKKIGVAAVVLAGLIALSRLYVGVHYPSDVVAGIALGCLVAYGVKRWVIDRKR